MKKSAVTILGVIVVALIGGGFYFATANMNTHLGTEETSSSKKSSSSSEKAETSALESSSEATSEASSSVVLSESEETSSAVSSEAAPVAPSEAASSSSAPATSNSGMASYDPNQTADGTNISSDMISDARKELQAAHLDDSILGDQEMKELIRESSSTQQPVVATYESHFGAASSSSASDAADSSATSASANS